jgi:hypothetical protein
MDHCTRTDTRNKENIHKINLQHLPSKTSDANNTSTSTCDRTKGSIKIPKRASNCSNPESQDSQLLRRKRARSSKKTGTLTLRLFPVEC